VSALSVSPTDARSRRRHTILSDLTGLVVNPRASGLAANLSSCRVAKGHARAFFAGKPLVQPEEIVTVPAR